MIRKLGCCACSLVMMAVLLGVGWMMLRPAVDEARQQLHIDDTSNYISQYNTAVSTFTEKMKEIESDPRYKNAVTETQRHAKHIAQMKEVVAAQKKCEEAMRNLQPPPSLRQFHDSSVKFMEDENRSYRAFQARVNNKDVRNLDEDLKRMDANARDAAARVDKSLADVPGYTEGKKKLQDVWEETKKAMSGDNVTPVIK